MRSLKGSRLRNLMIEIYTYIKQKLILPIKGLIENLCKIDDMRAHEVIKNDR